MPRKRKQHHAWKTGTELPTIRPHSQAKHRVLRAYLERYVTVLTARPEMDQFRLTLVDGFAGGGKYLDSRTKEERPGSPLIMLEAMREADLAASARRTKPFFLDVEYFFIEKDPDAFAHLREVIAVTEFRSLLTDRIHMFQDDFVTKVPAIIEAIKQRGTAGRVIFCLDQCGYTLVSMPTIRTILESLPNAEVILTFAVDYLIDYLAESEATQRRLERMGLNLTSGAIDAAKREQDWRRAIQFMLHREIPIATGARFYTPFFIRSTEAHRDLWLIHLSGHYRARDVMVDVHWRESSCFAHFGGSGLRMFGYDQDEDVNWTGQKMLPQFSFDDEARRSSREELLQQLPAELSLAKEGVVFSDLFSSLTNGTPVTAEIMRDVLGDLARDGVIEVRDKTGAKSRRAGVAHDSDIILPSRQKRLFLP